MACLCLLPPLRWSGEGGLRLRSGGGLGPPRSLAYRHLQSSSGAVAPAASPARPPAPAATLHRPPPPAVRARAQLTRPPGSPRGGSMSRSWSNLRRSSVSICHRCRSTGSNQGQRRGRGGGGQRAQIQSNQHMRWRQVRRGTDLKCVKPPKIAMPPMAPAAVLGLPEWTPTTTPAKAPPHMALIGSSWTLTLR